MTAQARQVIAFIANRQKRPMPEADWAHVLCLELNWLPPAKAREYIAACRAAGLLEGDDLLEPSFDPKKVEIERRFRLDPSAPLPSPADDLLDEIAGASGRSRSAVEQEISAKLSEHGGLLDPETAELLVAQAAGLSVERRARELLATIKANARPTSAGSGTPQD